MRLFAYLLLAALFLLLFVSRLVTDGMFIDGVVYATLSNNLAHGIGSFWALKHSDGLFPVFYEHPPLMPGLQSVFFKILGSGYGTERVYCAVVSLCTMGLMAQIWKKVFKGQKAQDWWVLPLFFWMLNEDAYLSYTSNILECTMALFDLCAFYVLFALFAPAAQPVSRLKQVFGIAMSALLLVLAFLTKGPAGLFPLVFFGAMAWAQGTWNWGSVTARTAILVAFTLGGIGLLLLYPPAQVALSTYFEQQVMAAIEGRRTENIAPHRLYMFQRFLETHAHFIILLALLRLFLTKRKDIVLPKLNGRPALLFGAMAAAALLPVMISPKQAPHYIVPALPWIALCLGSVAAALLVPLKRLLMPKWALIAMVILVLGAAAVVVLQYGKVRGDLAQLKPLFEHIPPGERIGFFEAQHILVLTSYFQRYNFNDIDRFNYFYEYLVFEKEQNIPTEIAREYKAIPVNSSKYILYKHAK